MWIFYAFLSSALIAITGFFDKLILRNVKPIDSLLAKTILMTLFVAIIVFFTTKAKTLSGLTKPEMLYILAAGVFGTFAWLTYNVALAEGPLSIVSLIYRASFIISIALGVLLLQESLSTVKIVGIIFSIIGLVLVSI